MVKIEARRRRLDGLVRRESGSDLGVLREAVFRRIFAQKMELFYII